MQIPGSKKIIPRSALKVGDRVKYRDIDEVSHMKGWAGVVTSIRADGEDFRIEIDWDAHYPGWDYASLLERE